MFHAKATGSTMTNSGLRPLRPELAARPRRRDGDARLPRRGRLVGRADASRLHADQSDRPTQRRKTPAAATRLWLDRLPDGKSKPPALPATCAQETYVRVYIPVQHPQPDDGP